MKTYKGKINQLESNGKNNYNLNGYTNQELADMFSYLDFIPKNVIFEEEFSTLLNKKLEI